VRDTYIDDDRYKILVKGLLAATHGDEPYAGYNENMIQIALGEAGGVWPASIKEDAVRAAIADRERNAGNTQS
jgi:hypothetical protein